MSYDVEVNFSCIHVVADPVVAYPPAPSPDLGALQLATAMWVGSQACQRLEHLFLDRAWELAEVALEYLRGNELEVRQLATPVDRSQGREATDLAAPDLRR